MPLKDVTFQSIGKGIKTLVVGKEKTPEEKEEIEKKRKEEQAYKQIISERQKQAWKQTYEQELARQRRLYAEKKEKETITRAMTKAQQDVANYNKPKPSLLSSFVGTFPKPTNSGLWDIPMGRPVVQQRYPYSAQAIAHKIKKHHRKHQQLRHFGTSK